MKKALSLLIVACLVSSICFAGGAKEAEKSAKADISFNKEGLPIVNEPITFEIAAATQKNKDFKELQFFKDLEEATNVQIT